MIGLVIRVAKYIRASCLSTFLLKALGGRNICKWLACNSPGSKDWLKVAKIERQDHRPLDLNVPVYADKMTTVSLKEVDSSDVPDVSNKTLGQNVENPTTVCINITYFIVSFCLVIV